MPPCLDGATSLFLASDNGLLAIVRALLAAGANVNAARTSDGATSLFRATLKGHLQVAQELKKYVNL